MADILAAEDTPGDVLLTASNQPGDVKRAYELGANAFLVKPMGMKELESFACWMNFGSREISAQIGKRRPWRKREANCAGSANRPQSASYPTASK